MPEFPSRSYGSPRRLPRRIHYQEGPDFLFLATQGGRPPDAGAQRGQPAVVRRRRSALRRWAAGEPVEAICLDLGCSRASLFRWRSRYAQGGLGALADGPRVGRASELPPALERLVITVRLLTYWNSRRIVTRRPSNERWANSTSPSVMPSRIDNRRHCHLRSSAAPSNTCPTGGPTPTRTIGEPWRRRYSRGSGCSGSVR